MYILVYKKKKKLIKYMYGKKIVVYKKKLSQLKKIKILKKMITNI